MSRSCLCLRTGDDGVITVTYYGREIGWINRIRAHAARGRRYRALSIHGDVVARGSIAAARAFLMERAV